MFLRRLYHFAKDRRNIKGMFKKEDFIEIYVKCDINSLKKRDPKGLYKKALSGEIPNFTVLTVHMRNQKIQI